MKAMHNSINRPHGNSRTRFVGTSHHANALAASLKADHPAVVEGRTIFPTRVKQIAEVPRVLVSGVNNAKLGKTVEVGAWAGMPIFTLTLQERATCPRTCHHWRSCFGNAMPMPRRHAHGPELIAQLDKELREHAANGNFVVRLHVLGDFYSTEYVAAWASWMREIPQIHVWGYTARLPDTEIGDLIDALNDGWPYRWRVRFSVPPDAPIKPMQVTTIWRQPEGARVAEGLSCPQQRDKFATCGTCGICWQLDKGAERIVFTGHGLNGGRKVATNSAPLKPERPVVLAAKAAPRAKSLRPRISKYPFRTMELAAEYFVGEVTGKPDSAIVCACQLFKSTGRKFSSRRVAAALEREAGVIITRIA